MNVVELLAPAKDKICAKAAIDFGADAVYIAAENFGARKFASNSIEDLKEVVNYAHKFNVKVYVTLNTILSDNEIQKAQILIKKLEEINVDALIIQDLGLLKLEHTIPFHASTQCDIRTLDKVKFLQDIGFERVVLARELSIEQIKNIKKNTSVELECFIHGALCVCYSGQCYLSYAIGGRSANKGECAQPCRKKYSLIDDNGNVIIKNKHLLALKDFNASEHIKTLAEIGVTSFKIEGRLKNVNYVKNVVAYYRKIIDNLGFGKTSWGNFQFDFEPNLEKSFNRGFTDYFLEKRKDCYSFDSVNSKGEYIGKIKKVNKDYFILDSDIKINPQDGLWFGNDGCLVNKITGDKIYPNKMPKISTGIKVFRNFDSEFDKVLKSSKTKRKMFAKIYFDYKTIKAEDEYGHVCSIKYDFVEKANNFDKMKQNITKAFSKSADSIYEIKSVEILTKNIPFIPISSLNELRRTLLNNLEKRKFIYKKQIFKPVYLNKELDYRANIMNSLSENFYKECNCNVKEYALESKKFFTGKCVMRTKHCLKFACGMCKKNVNLYLVDEKNKKYPLKFDCAKCEMEIYY